MAYLSEILPMEEKRKLFKGKGLNLCVAPTGTGKTYLIVNEMKNEYNSMESPFGAKRVLLLVNRSALLDQYLDSIDETFLTAFDKSGYYVFRNCVHVCSYQKAYINIKKDVEYLNNFDLILMDEAHYFLQDSWNGTTDHVFNEIMKRSENIPCTMFTATPEELIHYAKVREIEMEIIDYSSQLSHDRIMCVATNKDFREIITSIPLAEKYILFVNHKYSKEQIEKLAGELSTDSRCVGFYYSKWDKFGKKIIKNALMDEKFKNLVKLHKFEEGGAVANTAVDNGVDFKDEDLKHIILLDHYDPVTMKQMIGRKRFNFKNPSDKLTAWVINTDRKFLEREWESVTAQISMYEGYKKLNGGDFIERYADRLKHLEVYISSNNPIAESVRSISGTHEENEVVPCISVKFKRDKGISFVPVFSVKFCLVAKSYYKRKYLNFLLGAKVQYDDKVQSMALHKAMERLLLDMGFVNVSIDHKNRYHEGLAKKQEIAENINHGLIPFLEGQLGKSMDKETFDEFKRFMFDTFGVKDARGKMPGPKVIKQFLEQNGFALISRLTRIEGEQVRLYSINK